MAQRRRRRRQQNRDEGREVMLVMVGRNRPPWRRPGTTCRATRRGGSGAPVPPPRQSRTPKPSETLRRAVCRFDVPGIAPPAWTRRRPPPRSLPPATANLSRQSRPHPPTPNRPSSAIQSASRSASNGWRYRPSRAMVTPASLAAAVFARARLATMAPSPGRVCAFQNPQRWPRLNGYLFNSSTAPTRAMSASPAASCVRPVQRAASKEISPAVGAEFMARAPRSMAICGGGGIVNRAGKPRGHRGILVIVDQIFNEDGPFLQTPQARAHRHRQPLRRIGSVASPRRDERHLRHAAQPPALVGREQGGPGQFTATMRRHPARRQRRLDFAQARPRPARPLRGPSPPPAPVRAARVCDGASAWEKISTALLPPKPNELLITCLNGAGRIAVHRLQTQRRIRRGKAGIGRNLLMPQSLDADDGFHRAARRQRVPEKPFRAGNRRHALAENRLQRFGFRRDRCRACRCRAR